jgi:hypothetical protein
MAKLAPAEDAALRRRLRRSLAAVVTGGAGADAFDEAAAALDALREAELGRKVGRGEEEAHAVKVPAHFLCPISSRIMTDPVVVASGQVMTSFSLLSPVQWRAALFPRMGLTFVGCYCSRFLPLFLSILGHDCGQYPFFVQLLIVHHIRIRQIRQNDGTDRFLLGFLPCLSYAELVCFSSCGYIKTWCQAAIPALVSTTIWYIEVSKCY